MFKGTYTALVTPFNRDGSVDYGCLRALIDRQAAAYVVTGKADAGRRARTPRVKAGKGGER